MDLERFRDSRPATEVVSRGRGDYSPDTLLVALMFGLPGPALLDLHDQRPAKEPADENQQAQYKDGFEGCLQRNRAHDVGSDQDLEAQQQRVSQPSLVLPTCGICVVALDPLVEIVYCCESDGQDDDDGYGQDLDGQSGKFNPLQDGFTCSTASNDVV